MEWEDHLNVHATKLLPECDSCKERRVIGDYLLALTSSRGYMAAPRIGHPV